MPKQKPSTKAKPITTVLKGRFELRADATPEEVQAALAPSRKFMAKLLADKKIRGAMKSGFEIIKSKDGKECAFRVEGGGPSNPGIVSFDFYPWWILEWATDQANAVMRHLLGTWIKQWMTEQPGVVSDDFLETERGRKAINDCTADPLLVELIATQYISRLPEKLFHSLTEHELEIRCYFQGAWLKMAGVKGDDGVDDLAKQISAETRRWLKKSIAAIGNPNWGKMKSYYDELLPQAKDVKDVYERNQKRNWREMIKAGFPEFDEDLILMLSDEDADRALLSPGAQTAKMSEDYSLPSNMALEQAARRCGMKPFRLTPRRVRELMNGRSRKSASKKISLKRPRKVMRSARDVSPKRLVSTKIH